MTDEEMNRKMEFIVEQQAKFAAEIEISREVQATDAKRFREELEALKERDGILSDAILTVVGLVGTLAQTQARTDERVNLLADDFGRLAQAQARTEESLKILINTVERRIGGNGGSTNPA
ncbi:MAG TPA: hypothetical protein VMZ30_03625 [Pyrinomonadaceae bacterium]|nr:hypothetical protein [Pyrinomonadaceae bacterium]